MKITLDNLATRYHCLPSEALCKASTFDLHVMDVAVRWSNYQHELASTGKKPVPKLSQEKLTDMLNSVKAQNT